MARHLRVGAATPLVFPIQLAGMTSQWRIGDASYQPGAGVLGSWSYTLTTSTSRYSAPPASLS